MAEVFNFLTFEKERKKKKEEERRKTSYRSFKIFDLEYLKNNF